MARGPEFDPLDEAEQLQRQEAERSAAEKRARDRDNARTRSSSRLRSGVQTGAYRKYALSGVVVFCLPSAVVLYGSGFARMSPNPTALAIALCASLVASGLRGVRITRELALPGWLQPRNLKRASQIVLIGTGAYVAAMGATDAYPISWLLMAVTGAALGVALIALPGTAVDAVALFRAEWHDKRVVGSHN